MNFNDFPDEHPFHVLLKADPLFQGDVAYGKAGSSACHQLSQVSVLKYFSGTAGSMDHQHVFKQAGLLLEVCITVAALFWQ